MNEYLNEDTNEPTLTLKYGSFGILAVGAIKELKAAYDKKITLLEKMITELKQQ